MLELELIEHEGNCIVQVQISRDGEKLGLSYSTQASFDIEWPEFQSMIRGHELWQHTCLECFIADPESTAYVEVNLTPSGAWNAYHFDAYRQGMREAADIKLENLATSYGVLSAELTGLLPASEKVCIGLTAVLADKSRKLHYFATSHGDQPDFHARERHVLVRRDEL